MANLQNDLGAAIVATINAQTTRFSALGNSGGTLHVEYGSQRTEHNVGATGGCLVKPLPMEPVDGTDYDESAEVVIPFALEFELVDVVDAVGARAIIFQALHGTFRDRGSEMFGNFTDNGSNRLGKSGVVSLTDITDEVGQDGDRPKITARLDVSMWVVIPMA